MSYQKVKGSLLYEILIVILLALLLGTILYPKSVWKSIDNETDLCRENMKKVQTAEILYLQMNELHNYDSSLVKVLEFIQNDSTWLGDSTMYAFRDTFYVQVIRDYLTNYEGIDAKIAPDSAYKLVSLGLVDKLISKSFDVMHKCPTIDRTYDIGVVDTSVIKELKVFCPLDSADIDGFNDQFVFSFIGGGRVENHGHLDRGEQSWRDSKK